MVFSVKIVLSVFFSCEIGTYDVSCSKTCGHCKNSETCDIDTGMYEHNGCALPGFKSLRCRDKLLKQDNILGVHYGWVNPYI